MSEVFTPAEVFSPGEYLRDELEERGWTASEFAQIIGRPIQAVSEILNGRKEITAETATEIGRALGTSAEVWMNLQTAFRLHQVDRSSPSLDAVGRRSRLRQLVPLAEIRKLGWIPDTDDLSVLEGAVCALLGISDLDETPRFCMATRRTNVSESLRPQQLAWLGRVAALGAAAHVRPFDAGGLELVARSLARRLVNPVTVRSVAGWLADVGVAHVIVPTLKASKIDGAALLLDDRTPTVGLSTRGDRFDSFVFALLHELAHIVLGHLDQGIALDEDLRRRDDDSDIERAANAKAASWIFPEGLVLSPGPISRARVIAAAERHGVHPSLVVGRLQWDGSLPWTHLRNLVPPIRKLVLV
jgi:HTH-type transcriptional regulator/antitoxin HigA